MPLVVNGVCRFTFNGTIFDRPWANILDMQLSTTGTTVNRDDWVHDTAGNCINSWAEHIQPIVLDDCSLDSVSWVDLDQPNGTTGSRTSTSQHTLPMAGNVSNEGLPGNAAVLVRKETTSSRGTRNGRWYQAGLNETSQFGQSLSPAAVSLYQGAFDDFLDELNDESAGLGEQRTAVVVHTTGANPQTGTFTPINRFVVDARMATQRRRLRG